MWARAVAVAARPAGRRPLSGLRARQDQEDERRKVPDMAQRGVAISPLAAFWSGKLLGTLSLGLPAAFGALGFWWYRVRLPATKVRPLIDLSMQTRVLPDGSRISAFNKSDNLMVRPRDQAVATLYELLRQGALVAGERPMLGDRRRQPDGSKPYVWRTYADVLAHSTHLAHAFRELGLGCGQSHHVAIFCRNRSEWVITEHAAYMFSNVVVPLYETLGPASTTYILNQSETELLLCDDMDKAYRVLEQKPQCAALKFVVVVDKHTVSAQCRQNFAAGGLTLYTFDELLEMGHQSQNRMAPQPPSADTLATICYTSGTTGTPKGVMLTHGNIIADVTCYEYVEKYLVGMGDVIVSFLPMAHMYERVIQNIAYLKGACVGFWRGRMPDLADDLRELKPTCMPCVPRVLNRVYDRVQSELHQNALKKFVFDVALDYKMRELRAGVIRHDTIFDKLVFKKVRDVFGGRLLMLITGSAPISREVLDFSRCVFGCHVLEGYGQTECVAAASLTIAGDTNSGHVGVPIPCCAVKLVDVPDMNYWASEGRGEICIRGANVTQGYYKDVEGTRSILDADGWLRTGDIGMWRPEGTLAVIDRKKHMFKLAQGEYVAPEKIENAYGHSPYVAQLYVHGEPLKSWLVAVVHPDPDVLVDEAERVLGVSGLSVGELCKRQDVKALVLDDMLARGRENGLNSFEQVKDIHLTFEAFSIENELLTPTLKARRPNLQKHYEQEIADMYAKIRK